MAEIIVIQTRSLSQCIKRLSSRRLWEQSSQRGREERTVSTTSILYTVASCANFRLKQLPSPHSPFDANHPNPHRTLFGQPLRSISNIYTKARHPLASLSHPLYRYSQTLKILGNKCPSVPAPYAYLQSSHPSMLHAIPSRPTIPA